MDIRIIPTFERAWDYLRLTEHDGDDCEGLWRQYMIKPYWADIAQWAPFDQSFKQPAPVQDLRALHEQLRLLSLLPVGDLQAQFMRAVNALTSDGDGSTLVALYPLCDSYRTV